MLQKSLAGQRPAPKTLTRYTTVGSTTGGRFEKAGLRSMDLLESVSAAWKGRPTTARPDAVLFSSD
jgi:hypothetical protein